MVRRFTVIFVLLVCMFSFSAGAYFIPGQSIYDDSSVISSTYLSLFDRLSLRVGLKDYVLYRSGQYEYTLVYGDLIWNGTAFSGQDVSFCALQTYHSYNSDYDWSSGDLSTFSLSVNGRFVYSSLGGFPQLDFNNYYLVLFCAITLLAYVLLRLILNMFASVRRV